MYTQVGIFALVDRTQVRLNNYIFWNQWVQWSKCTAECAIYSTLILKSAQARCEGEWIFCTCKYGRIWRPFFLSFGYGRCGNKRLCFIHDHFCSFWRKNHAISRYVKGWNYFWRRVTILYLQMLLHLAANCLDLWCVNKRSYFVHAFENISPNCDESRTFKILCVLAQKCALLLFTYFISLLLKIIEKPRYPLMYRGL